MTDTRQPGASASPSMLRVETIVAIGMCVSLAVVLHHTRLFRMPQGGSVTLGSSLPVWLVAFRYGACKGMVSGLCTGMVLFILGGMVAVHPAQPILDYALAWGVLGVAGAFEQVTTGVTVASLLRYGVLCLSGSLFFRAYAPSETHYVVYVALYNLPSLIDSVVAGLLLFAVNARAPHVVQRRR